jgi:hypothetical protein
LFSVTFFILKSIKAAKSIAQLVLSRNYKKAAKKGLKASGNVYTIGRIEATCLYKDRNVKG